MTTTDGPFDPADPDLPEAVRRLARVWHGIGGAVGHPAPEDKLTPLLIFPLVPYLAMVDFGHRPQVRWAGNAVKERLGGNPVAMVPAETPLAPLLPPAAAEALVAGTPWHVRASLATGSGPVGAEAYWFPLTGAAVASIAFEG
jgi:hypothetical protein